MILVTKLDGTPMFLNGDWIQSVETTPDTVITLMNGFKLMVKNSVEEVVQAYKQHKRETLLINGENA